MKVYKALFIAVILLIICFPFGAMGFFFSDGETEYEYYNKSTPMSWKQVTASRPDKLTSSLEKYLNEHAAKRQAMITLYSKPLYDIDVSSNMSNVIIGKNKMLFWGKSFNNLRALHPDMKLAVKRVKAVDAIAGYCENKGAEFIFVLAPSKEEIYPENLPGWYTGTGGLSDHEAFVKAYQESGDSFNMVDLTDALVRSKQTYGDLLYSAADMHWTKLGAYLGYREVVSRLKTEYKILNMRSYKTVDATSARNLSKTIGIYDNFIDDFEISVDYENSVKLKTNYLDKNDQTWESYLQYKNPDALYQKKVLLIRDSFSSKMSPYLSSAFSELRLIHYRQILSKADAEPSLKSIMANYKPDLVIFEMADWYFSYLETMDKAVIK